MSAAGMIAVLSTIGAGARGAGLPADQQVVNVNVVATDNHGNPVDDLKASELYVTDAGKQQDILFFKRIDRRLPPVPELPPGEYANRNRFTIPHATVILFDFMNQRFSTRAQASNALVKYLQSAESADYLYLYFLTIEGQIVPVRGLDSETTPGAPLWTKDSKRLIEQATEAVLKVRPVDLDVWTRTLTTFRALDALGAQLARVPGRKNVVWITDGVPIDLGPVRSGTGDVVDFGPQLRQLSTALEQAGIAIYPVSEIMIGSSAVLSDLPGDGGDRSGSPSAGLNSRATLDEISGITGGRPVGIRDIGGAINQAMNDARISYELGYAPPDDNWNSKFHKIKIVCRRKGVRIQAKTGYYAWPEQPGIKAVAAMRLIARDPVDASEIGMRGSLTRSTAAPGAFRFDVRINAADVMTIPDGNKTVGRLSAAILSYGPAGPAGGLAEIPPLIPLDVNGTADGIRFAKDFRIDGDVKQIRVAVYDDLGGTVGSLTMPVPAPASGTTSK